MRNAGDASELITRFQCNRCHEISNVAAAPRDKHCVACHQQIHAGTFEVGAAQLAKWQSRITSLRWAPSLAAADRLRRSWVRDFLLAPHDVRPGLVAQMPRLALTAAEADRLAAYLAPQDAARREPDADDIARGESLFRALACGRCHRFTGASLDDESLHTAGKSQVGPLDGSWALAPDLRFTRARMEMSTIADWIVAPRGAMPRLGVAQADARALAAYIVATPLTELAPRAPAKRLPLLSRRVTFDEVEARVFRNVCWHCHATPDFARGDGGPGNSGGFGYASRGLDVTSYAAISAGSLDDAGERRSVFAPLRDGTPRLVAHLLARHTEEAGGSVAGVRGMPLGLPARPLDEIQLVDTWIAQGRPR
jgi:mono/diheme cytochrome c family protein